MNLQGIRSSVSLLGSQYSQCKERKREEEGERGRGRAESSAESVQTVQVRGETGFPLTLSRSKLLKGWIVIAKERSYKGGNVCIFNEFARAFPGSESNVGGRKHGFRVGFMDFFFSCSSFPVFREEGKRERVEGIFQLRLRLFLLLSLRYSEYLFFYFFFYCIVKKRKV